MTVEQMRRLRARCPRWDAIVTEAEVGQEWARLAASSIGDLVVVRDGEVYIADGSKPGVLKDERGRVVATWKPGVNGLPPVVVRVDGQEVPCREVER